MIKTMYVLGEPLHTSAYWYTMMHDAITQRAAYRRQQIIDLSMEQLDRIPPACAPVIVIGATRHWQDEAVRQLRARNLRCVLLSTNAQSISENVSVITLNQSSMAEYAVRYFCAAERRRIAYVAYNPRSITDNAKLEALRAACRLYGLAFGEGDIYPFDGDLEQCVDSFAAQCAPYDAVLCANDVSGIMLARHAGLAEKKRIPRDMYVISYGNTLLSKLISPTLTSVTLDYRQAGTIAVDNVIYLRKNPGISAQCTIIRARMILGASTDFLPAPEALPLPSASEAPPPGYPGFYGDPVTKEILQMEAMLNSLDATGLRIVLALLQGQQKKQILDSLYIAESTYKYRLRRICAVAGVRKKEDLIARLRRWIDPPALDAYLAGQSAY